MNCENSCINGSEIVSLLWKIGSDPWISSHTTPFIQGDQATALLKVELNDCDSFEGLTLDAFVQVPNPDQDIVSIHATIDSDNKAIFTLPDELLWWPGAYTVNFMFTDGGKVNYSNIVNNAYTVNANPVLAGQNPPTILPGDKADYEQLIADLNAENTRAETNLPLLEAENERAEQNIIDAGNINTELEGTIADAGTAKTDLEGTISDSETAKSNLEQTITDSETAKTNLEGTITDSETAKTNLEGTIADAGQAQSDLQDVINEVPGKIQDITDEGNTQVARVISEGDTQVARVNSQGTTEVNRVIAEGDTQENRVVTEGNTQVDRVEDEGDSQVTRVNNQGTTEVNRVKNEGTTQVIRVGDKGDEEYQRLNDLIQTSPTGGNAILLDGRSRTSFEEDIESRQYALDNRLVYAFEPHKRNIENLEHGMYVKNPLTNGDGTIKSEDADSMAGVFDDVNKNFYCGKGYENYVKTPSIFDRSSGGGAPIVEDIESTKKFKIGLSGTLDAGVLCQILSNVLPLGISSIKMKLTKYGKAENNITVSKSYIGSTDAELTPVNDFYEYTGEVTSVNASYNNFKLSLSNTDTYNASVDYVIVEYIVYTKTEDPKVWVKDTAPDGKLIIKEPWTSETHSFITADLVGYNTRVTPYVCDENGSLNGERFTPSSLAGIDPNSFIYFLCSSLFKKFIFNNGTLESNADPFDVFISQGLIRFTRSTGGSSDVINKKIILIYEGNLTEAELRNELEKIKSGQYYIPNTGVYEPVQGSKRRANEYGRIKDYVMIESQSTDLQLVETDKLVYTEAYDGTKRRDRIDSVGVISGDGGIEDVGGYIRLTASTTPSASTPVKVVIEIEN